MASRVFLKSFLLFIQPLLMHLTTNVPMQSKASKSLGVVLFLEKVIEKWINYFKLFFFCKYIQYLVVSSICLWIFCFSQTFMTSNKDTLDVWLDKITSEDVNAAPLKFYTNVDFYLFILKTEFSYVNASVTCSHISCYIYITWICCNFFFTVAYCYSIYSIITVCFFPQSFAHYCNIP